MVRARTACIFLTSQLPKVFGGCGVLYILTSKCASRHKGVHFFNISTSKSAPNPSLFLTYTIDFEMCFAPHLRVLFRPVNFERWCENGVFWTFRLPNLTSECASRHNGVQLFISYLAMWLRARCFSEPPEPQIIGKT